MSRFAQLIGVTASILLVLIVLDFMTNIPYWSYLSLLSIFLILLTLGVFNMRYHMFLHAYIEGDKAEKMIALTFDDGPNVHTYKVLEILNKYGARATFFCIGSQIEKYPDVLKKMDEYEHLIGNHTYNHGYFINFKNKNKLNLELLKTEKIIEQLTDKKTLIFRPPFGVTNPIMANTLRNTNYKVIGWSIRSFDTVRPINEKLICRIVHKIVPGAVILLHDKVENSLLLLEGILQFAQKHDYRCVGVDEIFKIKVYE